MRHDLGSQESGCWCTMRG